MSEHFDMATKLRKHADNPTMDMDWNAWIRDVRKCLEGMQMDELTLKSRVERLETAIKEILELGFLPNQRSDQMRKIAKAALSGEEGRAG